MWSIPGTISRPEPEHKSLLFILFHLTSSFAAVFITTANIDHDQIRKVNISRNKLRSFF